MKARRSQLRTFDSLSFFLKKCQIYLTDGKMYDTIQMSNIFDKEEV